MKKLVKRFKEWKSIRDNDKKIAKSFNMTLRKYYKSLKVYEAKLESEYINPWDDPMWKC